MKKFNILIIIFVMVCAYSQDNVLPQKEQIVGYEWACSINEAINEFNSNVEKNSRLSEEEVLNAVLFELQNTHPNNNKAFRDILLNIVKAKKLPKGALLKEYSLQVKSVTYKPIYLILNMDLQPQNLVPEPNSIDLIKRIPIRVCYHSGGMLPKD